MTAPDVFKILRAELKTGPEAFQQLKGGIKVSLAHLKGANSSQITTLLAHDEVLASAHSAATLSGQHAASFPINWSAGAGKVNHCNRKHLPPQRL